VPPSGGEGGNDLLIAGPGNDVLIGDQLNVPPFIPSNGNNDDHLIGGPGNDVLAGLGGDDVLDGGAGKDMIIGFGASIASTEALVTTPRWPGRRSGFRRTRRRCRRRRQSGVPAAPAATAEPHRTNNDDCRGGPGSDTVLNCESTS
jgi:Ca2+-binding RTX toxin-like protein